jgi:hypothetical protein
MLKRQRIFLTALLALTAVFALLLRPVGVNLFDIPPAPDSIEILGVPNSSEHCVVITDCETILTVNTNVDIAHLPLLPIFGGVAFMVLATAVRPNRSPALTISNPPPRLAGV